MLLQLKDKKIIENKKITQLKYELKNADAIVIGAGAGLSASAGFTYHGERFKKYFSDFEEKYGFHDMYLGGFYPYQTLEEYWAYWSRYIYVNRYMNTPKSTYQDLFNICSNYKIILIFYNIE